ncbi:MAG: exopolysaccharide production protein ExoQ [Chloroflexota bacterium]|nr:exopolysaccharide production protein ExoQ [Chloroflexota bacterium]
MNRIALPDGASKGARGPAVLLDGFRPALARIEDTFGLSERRAALVAVAALGVVVVGVSAATRLGILPEAAGLAAAFVAILLSLRWPLLPLFAFVMLIPVEEVLVLGGGTLSRYAEILFIVAYAVPRVGKLTIRAMPVAAWGYVAWAILSLGWAIAPNETLLEIPVLVLLFITAVVLAALIVERPTIVRPLLWAYSLTAAATAALGVYGTLMSGAIAGANDRAGGLQDQNPAYFAAILLPALVFSLFELVNGRQLVISSVIAGLTAAAIAASGTRGAWVAVIVVVAVFIMPRLAPAKRLGAILVIATAGLIALQIPGLAPFLLERAETAVTTGGAGRTDIWSVGLTIYQSAPITGVGLADFPSAYTPERVRDSDVGVYSANNGAFRAPHNIVIGTLGELGLIGLFLLTIFLLPLVLRRGWGPDAVMVQAALASLVITAFFLDVLNRKQLWLLAGIACGLLYLARVHSDREAAMAARRTILLPSSAAIDPSSTEVAGPLAPAGS